MKKVQLNIAGVITVIVGVGVACAAGGAVIGYDHGYKKGDFDARHEASRSATSAISQVMTSGVHIKQPDGTEKTFVLQPVETTGH